mgnify:CR=1 FL=1
MSDRVILPIDFSPVSNFHHLDKSDDIVNAVDNAIVTLSDAIAFRFT